MIKSIINSIFFNKSFDKKIEQAYKTLEKNSEIEKIYEIKEKLQNLARSNLKSDNSFFEYNLDLNLSLNQFIYSKFINTPYFTSKLIFSIAFNEKFYFPAPRKYLDVICKFTKVSLFKSKILLILLLIFYTLYQFFFIFINIKNFLIPKKINDKKIFLNSIPKLYSNTSADNNNLDFFKWVINYFQLNSKIYFIHSNKFIKDKKIIFSDFDYETNYFNNPLIIFFNPTYFKFYIKSFIKTLQFIIQIFLNKNTELLFLLKEVFFFFYLKELPKKLFYNYCLFNNSNMVFRPLWSYVNEKKNTGSVILYFYSTNMMPLLQEIEKKKYFDIYGYSLHSWPTYLTWNNDQKNWLKNNIRQNSKFKNESLVPFVGKHIKLQKKKKTITIFDVPPKRPGIYCLLNNSYNIYSYDYCQKFLNDIVNSIPQKYYSQTEIILKLKKDYNNIDPNYRVLVERIVRNKKIRLITDISPESIIEVSDATISIPFTSTAVTSYNKNKETIYYDPSGKLTKNNCLEKNITLISSQKNLKFWILNILNK